MIRKKISILGLFVGAMLLLTATGVLAASPVTSDSHPAGEEAAPATTISPTVSITNPVAWAIGNFFSSLVFSPTYTVTVQSVLDFHASGMGYGEIARCFFVAHSAGVPPETILMLRQGEEKIGWGEIAKSLQLAPGNKGRNLGGIRSGRVVTETQTMTDTVGVRAKPEKGPEETPPGWEHGKGLGRDKDKDHGRGHNK